MDCPLRAKYRYEDQLPTRQSAKASFGTICHKSLEYYFQSHGDYDGTVERFRSLWDRPERLGVKPDYWPPGTDWVRLRNKGIEIIDRLHNQQPFRNWTVIGTEIAFLVPFGEHELTGFVDLVVTERSGTGTEILKIIDFKTNSKDPTKSELALNPQFTTYAYALRQREAWTGIEGNPNFPGIENGDWLWETAGKLLPHRSIWYSLWNGKELDAGPRDETDFGRLYRVCDQIAHAIDSQIYVPKIGESCTFCDFVEPCAMDIPVAIANLDNPNDPARWI